MAPRALQSKSLKHLKQVVEERIEATFQEIVRHKLVINPTWLFTIYNDYTKISQNFKMSIREKKERLLQLSKILFVETAIHVNLDTALLVNKKLCPLDQAA